MHELLEENPFFGHVGLHRFGWYRGNEFHPIVQLPSEYWVLNLQKPQSDWNQHFEYTIGRYDEDRKGMYTQALFGGERTIHVGLDIGGPAMTPVFAFEDGIIHSFADNDEDGSYGPTIITEHQLVIEGQRRSIWLLHGHLSRQSLVGLNVGTRINKGDQIASIGEEHENGVGLHMFIFSCRLLNLPNPICKALFLLKTENKPSRCILIRETSWATYTEASSARYAFNA